MSTTALPAEVVAEDSRLETAANKANEALAKHRWHWTLDESNPDRVSMREYARAVSRDHKTIRGYVNGYAEWAGAAGSPTLNECIERARMSADQETYTEAVAEANQVTFPQARKAYAPDVTRVREAVHQEADRRQRAAETERETAQVQRREPDPTVVAREHMPPEERVSYAHRYAEQIARSKASEAKREGDKKRALSANYMYVDAKLTHAYRDLKEVLDYQQRGLLDLPEAELELVRDSVSKVKAVLDLVNLAITGSVDVDWDKEMENLS